LNIKRLGLTAFFIVLTLSIGVTSVNLPISSYAQSNALSRSGVDKIDLSDLPLEDKVALDNGSYLELAEAIQSGDIEGLVEALDGGLYLD
jgi:hypothetical protein